VKDFSLFRIRKSTDFRRVLRVSLQRNYQRKQWSKFNNNDRHR